MFDILITCPQALALPDKLIALLKSFFLSFPLQVAFKTTLSEFFIEVNDIFPKLIKVASFPCSTI